MAITDFATYKSLVAGPHQAIRFTKSGGPTRAFKMGSYLQQIGLPWAAFAVPTTPAAPTRATTGALGQRDPASANLLRILNIEWANDTTGGTLMICDRLSHQGGLDATVTTPQTTNLPTAALTRYTTGVGVLAAIEIYTLIGATGTTVTVSYTNEAGTAGQTSRAIVLGATDNREANLVLPISLQAGDTGVRSVESVTVLATTATAGNFGIVLYRPIISFNTIVHRFAHDLDAMLGALLQFEPIVDGACLWPVLISGSNNLGSLTGTISIAEDV